MVWGVPSPVSFGKYFPNGEYAGWRESLIEYFENEMPVDRKGLFHNALAYPSYVGDKFVKDPAWAGSSRRPPFSPVEAHEVPKRFVLGNIRASLGSMITTTDFIPAVDEPLKSMIERFEPGVHRFYPIEVSMKYAQGSQILQQAYPERFFILEIGRHINSFLPDQSETDSYEEICPGHFFYKRDKKPMSGLALSRQIFDNAHMWRESRLSIPLICFSEILMAEISEAGLQLPKRYRLKEV